MSLFGSIMSRIFGHPAVATPTGATPAALDAGTPGANPGAPATTGGAAASAAAAPVAPGPHDAASPGATAAQPPVDVAAVLEGMAAKNPEKLNWKQSIVDLMKLLDLDSSLGARKELAKELQYSGSTDDSASMNVWLHREVMQKLAANGGKVPADLQH